MRKSKMARVSEEMDAHLNSMSSNLGISKTEASRLMVLQSNKTVIINNEKRKKKRDLRFGGVIRL